MAAILNTTSNNWRYENTKNTCEELVDDFQKQLVICFVVMLTP